MQNTGPRPSGTGPVEALRSVGDRVDELVATGLADRGDAAWTAATPAEGWTVATQVAHLLWTDEVSLSALRDPDGFADTHVAAAMEDPLGHVDAEAHRLSAVPREELLSRWRATRAALADELDAADPGATIPWFGPPMRPKSMATARIMETWAHGTDIADALGARLDPAGALPHVARIGVRTRDFAHRMNGLEPPAGEFRVELTDAAGAVHAFGPEDADQRVTGGLEDFCLLVTQRVHRADTDLVAEGEDAERWLGLAQAFAGLSGGGRPEGSRR